MRRKGETKRDWSVPMVLEQILERLVVDEVRHLVRVGGQGVVVVEAQDVQLVQSAMQASACS